ncbi:MAG: hypothetical protein IRZ07_02495 [Microbispora sp.]|nr:hypothetical protein [Microbispora sp.]
MKRILQLVVVRWLARTPLGVVVLGIVWLIMRRRRARARQPAGTAALHETTAPARRGPVPLRGEYARPGDRR